MAKVLIIDDSPDMLSMLAAFFERRTPHDVILCKDGREGLSQASATRPDLALVDVMMPGIDGYEVVRRLRGDPDTQGMGIIMLTARGQPVDKQAAVAAGADAHMTKPVAFSALEAVITDVLAKASATVAPQHRRILPVMSLKGGVGRTTVAVNLAVLLQQLTPTSLWDFSVASGHAALFLGIKPTTHWGTYAQHPDLKPALLLQEHASGLRVLCAPPMPPETPPLSKEQVTSILETLTGIAGTVVIDMPPHLNPGTLAIYAAADRVLLVTGDTPPAIQCTLVALQALQRQNTPVMVLHNIPDPGGHPHTDALQRVLRTPIHGALPFDPAQEAALGRGVPLAVAQGDSPLIAALRDNCARPLVDRDA